MENDFTAVPRALPVAQLDAQIRGNFIVRTYAHLLGAILLFTGLEVFFFQTSLAERIATGLMSTSWLLILGGFVVVSWLASRTALMAQSKPMQYLALAGYVAAEAIIFVPLLAVANVYAPGAIQSAALTTIVGFVGLTFIAFGTRKDFSFLRPFLMWIGFSSLLLIVMSVIFGWYLGTWFSVAMVVFAGACILYDTSKIMNSFPVDRHVGAALQLFASVALMFWYVLRIFLDSRR